MDAGVEIQAEDLSFTYPSGVAALQGVSLRIGPGESVALIGQNGAGKTTLVKHFNGLLQPTAGRVLVAGEDARQRSVASLAARVGFAFQNPDDQLFQRTVWDEVIFGARNLGWSPERVEAAARAALETVGLSRSAQKHPYDLNPSLQRMTALAAVLAMDTPVLVLDEPTTGHDHEATELVGGIVEELKEQGKTVLAVTHDIDFCAEHFERVLVMAQGRLLLDGPAREVLRQEGLLAQTYVEPPQLVRLAARLDLAEAPLNVDEFLESWMG